MNSKNEHIGFKERVLIIFSVLYYWDIHQSDFWLLRSILLGFKKKKLLLFSNRHVIYLSYALIFFYKLHMEQSSLIRCNTWPSSYRDTNQILKLHFSHCIKNMTPFFDLTGPFSYFLAADYCYDKQKST